MSRVFYCRPPVLIPRIETEDLVRLAFEVIRTRHPKDVLEVGFGSGIISITLAKIYPKLNITALDTSQKALRLAKMNQVLHDTSITLLKQDIQLYSSLNKFDLIVSNPPYIETSFKGDFSLKSTSNQIRRQTSTIQRRIRSNSNKINNPAESILAAEKRHLDLGNRSQPRKSLERALGVVGFHF